MKGIQLSLLASLILFNLFTGSLGILRLSGAMLDFLVGCDQVRFLDRCQETNNVNQKLKSIDLDFDGRFRFFDFSFLPWKRWCGP